MFKHGYQPEFTRLRRDGNGNVEQCTIKAEFNGSTYILLGP